MVVRMPVALAHNLTTKILPSEYPARHLHRRRFMGRRSVLCLLAAVACACRGPA